MDSFVRLACAMLLATLAHLGAMACCARALGIGVRRVAFGVGPRVADAGLFRLALLPLGGHVKLAMAADAVDADGVKDGAALARAFDAQPAWKRVAVPLAGPLALLALSRLLPGVPDAAGAGASLWKIAAGAVDPFGQAQATLHEAGAVLRAIGFPATLGLVAFKLAVLNLIPYLGSNGLQALQGVLPWHVLESQAWQRLQGIVALPLMLLLAGGWLVAVVVKLMAT